MPHKNSESGKEYRRQYYLRNKERIAEAAKLRHEKNREKDQARKGAWWSRNRDRILAEKRAQWRLKHPPRIRMKRDDNGRLTLKEQERVLGKKPVQCEACGRGGKICFDHDHVSGSPRGWLCHNCNITLGHVADNSELLEMMAGYLAMFDTHGTSSVHQNWGFVIAVPEQPDTSIIGTTLSPGSELREHQEACPEAGFIYVHLAPIPDSVDDAVINQVLHEFHIVDRLYQMTPDRAIEVIEHIRRDAG